MKEAIVEPGTQVKIIDSPIPIAKAGQVVIKVVCSGCNPKDFKVPEWTKISMNQGDDIAGFVHTVGTNVTEFKPGDRVAAFHEFVTPHGSWAEYAVAWAYTTFHLPAAISFEEAATIPLAAMTAAVCLYCVLDLPEPWKPLHNIKRPLVVYGASGAVGSYAIQLARLSNIHPIIAVAGNARDQVEKLIDRQKGDVICDYRSGDEALLSEMKDALGIAGQEKVEVALDCMSEAAKGSYSNISKILSPRGHICLIQNYDPQEFHPEVIHTRATVRWVHQNINTYAGVCTGPIDIPKLTDSETGCREFGYIMFRFFSRALEMGWLKGHPYKVIVGGLAGIQTALDNLKAGHASGIKYIVQIADTPSL